MKCKPLFILGCPRSGTTLLSRLLTPTHFGSPVETHFITKYHKILYKYGDISKKRNFSRLAHDIIRERPIMQWNLDFDTGDIWEHTNRSDYADIINYICMKRFSSIGKTSWGDKTPHYIIDLKIIYELFPDSKYIYIVRDGRDVALSLLQRPWGPNNVYACAGYWRLCNRDQQLFTVMRDNDQLFTIKYETLLKNPSKVIKELYNFLEEPLNENLLKDQIVSIKSNNFNKWKRKMHPRDVMLFETIASDTLKRFDYETSYNEKDLNMGKELIYKGYDSIIRYYQLIKLNSIDAVKIKFFRMDPFGD